MLLVEGMSKASTIDEREKSVYLEERTFWRNVLERLIHIVMFLSETILAFGVLKIISVHLTTETFAACLNLWRKEIF